MEESDLWLERVYNKIGVPFSVGVICLSFLPILALRYVVGYLVGLSVSPWSSENLVRIFNYFVATVVSQYGARFIRRDSRQAFGSVGVADFWNPKFGFALGLAVSIGVLVSNVFLPTSGYTLVQNVAIGLVFALASVNIGTFLYTLFASMLSVITLGMGPMRLAHFSYDPMLGLRPFAGLIGRLMFALYLFFSALTLVPVVLGVSVADLTFWIVTVGFYVSGVVLLWSMVDGFHKQMVGEKRKWVEWIDELYRQRVDEIRKVGKTTESGGSDGLLPGLSGIVALRDEIHEIYEWPFARKLWSGIGAGIVILSSVVAIVEFVLHR
jgi:hypothetical protein